MLGGVHSPSNTEFLRRAEVILDEVRNEIGYALYYAQKGNTHPSVKIFKGHGSGVYEIVSDFNTDAYRAVYVVNIDDWLYVLHTFQKII